MTEREQSELALEITYGIGGYLKDKDYETVMAKIHKTIQKYMRERDS